MKNKKITNRIFPFAIIILLVGTTFATAVFLAPVAGAANNTEFYDLGRYEKVSNLTAQRTIIAANWTEAMTNFFNAQNGFGGWLLNMFYGMTLHRVAGALFEWAITSLVQEAAKKSVETVFNGALACYNPGTWIKLGFCATLYPLGVSVAPHLVSCLGLTPPVIPVPFGDTCMITPYVIPIYICTMQALLIGSDWSKGFTKPGCIATDAWKMPLPAGSSSFQRCYLCNIDPNRPCTQARCTALSSLGSGGCSFENYECTPNKELMKRCEETGGIRIAIENVLNFSSITASKYEKSNIEWNVTKYEVNISTNKYAECRYYTTRGTDWEDMIQATLASPQGILHTLTLDISDATKKEFNFYAECQDSCTGTGFSETKQLVIKKKEKPDVLGPITLSTYPASDQILEGDSSGKRNVIMKVVTDENSLCKYMRFKEMEGMEGFYSSVTGKYNTLQSSIDQNRDSMEGMQKLANEAAVKLDWNDARLAYLGESSWENAAKEHGVTLTGLNNSQIYAYYVLCEDASAKHNIADMPTILRFKISTPFTVYVSQPTGRIDESPEIEIKAATDIDAVCRYNLDNLIPYEKNGHF